MTIRRRQVRQPRKYRDVYGNLMIDGYTFLGRPRVPPLPNRIALRDRVTGAEKVLSHDGAPGSIDLVDVNSRWSDVTHYGSYDGPYFGDYRLYLDNGTLAAEYALGHGSQTILTRKDFDTTVLQITINQTTGAVEYTEYEL